MEKDNGQLKIEVKKAFIEYIAKSAFNSNQTKKQFIMGLFRKALLGKGMVGDGFKHTIESLNDVSKDIQGIQQTMARSKSFEHGRFAFHPNDCDDRTEIQKVMGVKLDRGF